MTTPAPTVDVAGLPTTVFGHRSPMWWGTLAFMVIEGSTVLICLVAYLYLRQDVVAYPPPGMPRPSLGPATLQLALLTGSIVPMAFADRAARRLDLRSLRHWLLLSSGIAVMACAIRIAGFHSLNVRWDDNAYGSAVWFIVGFHTMVLVFEAVETIIFTALLYRRRTEQSMFSAAVDNAAYWYFMALIWIPCYLMIFVLPRVGTW